MSLQSIQYWSYKNKQSVLSNSQVLIITLVHYNSLNIIKFPDLVPFHIAIFMYKFHNHLLPSVFQSFFIKVNEIHCHNTRHAAKQSFYLPKVRRNYENFNIRFQGPWYGILLLMT